MKKHVLAWAICLVALIEPVSAQRVNPELVYKTSFKAGSGSSPAPTTEIAAYDPATRRLFVVNSGQNKLEILDISDIRTIHTVKTISMALYGGGINSVDVHKGIVAAAVENVNPQRNGRVVFLTTDGQFLNSVEVGAMPDMVVFSPNGQYVLTANEGEPNTAYTDDPNGSISIIALAGSGNKPKNLTQQDVRTLDFTAYNGREAELRAMGIRIFGKNASASQDFEPEYITVAHDSQTAYVTLQENNAIAVVDINSASLTNLLPLGFKDHSLAGNGFDASDNGTTVSIIPRPVKGIYMPDALANFEIGGQRYLITANEGDAREYDGFSEILRLGNANYKLDPTAFPNAAALKANANLGRLNVTTTLGDTDSDGDFDEIYALGARSFSIWNADSGEQVYDSGDTFEQITRQDPVYGPIFNASNTTGTPTLKNRSDDKGPEPEGVTVAKIGGKTYAYISLERIGGIMVYNISNPRQPEFLQYINNRSTTSGTGDLGPEGILYIQASESPNDTAMIILANEVSSTISIYNLRTEAPGQASARAATASAEGWRMQVLENPVQQQIQVEVTGITGQPLHLSLTDLQGRVIESKRIGQAGPVERHTFQVGHVPAGLLLLRATNDTVTQTLRVLKK
ncbi:choice-of-anchor I family protein [Nibrella saemangeumensis]|uniref:Choice-of-anchor I family protein n=1 Tax=Nibrella saemangeumensis TaxID=1084526 RepID=A0ABP8MSY5_9BACT